MPQPLLEAAKFVVTNWEQGDLAAAVRELDAAIQAQGDDSPARSHSLVLVDVQGGLVQAVYCSDREAEVVVVDWDTEGCSPKDDQIVPVECHGRPRLAHISRRPVHALGELRSDAVAALRKAGIEIR